MVKWVRQFLLYRVPEGGNQERREDYLPHWEVQIVVQESRRGMVNFVLETCWHKKVGKRGREVFQRLLELEVWYDWEMSESGRQVVKGLVEIISTYGKVGERGWEVVHRLIKIYTTTPKVGEGGGKVVNWVPKQNAKHKVRKGGGKVVHTSGEYTTKSEVGEGGREVVDRTIKQAFVRFPWHALLFPSED
jgi:hypothetical protein